jgi:hypothetical protein
MDPCLTLGAGAFLVGVFCLLLSYYPLITELWKRRFREINGVDHVGFVLELVFFLVTGGIAGFMWWAYPQAAAAMLASHRAAARFSNWLLYVDRLNGLQFQGRSATLVCRGLCPDAR